MSLLFPSTELTRQSRHRPRTMPERTFSIAPSVGHPRLLIPMRPHGAGAIALRSYGGRLSTLGKWGYLGLARTYRLTGALGPRFIVDGPDPTTKRGIDDHLSDVLGEPVAVAIHLTPSRGNRKPVLQALVRSRSSPAAFVKVGTNPITHGLAEREARALRLVSSQRTNVLTAPAVLDLGQFNGLTVLTLQSLPTWQPGRLPDPSAVIDAAMAVAALEPRMSGPMSQAGRWQRLSATIDQLPAQSSSADALRETYAALSSIVATIDVETGASHGDFSPWNMWQTKDQLLIWDWERFSTGVPIGSDLIHYKFQQLLIARGGLPSAVRTVVEQAPVLLGSSVQDAAAARATALVHLFALAMRYEADRQLAPFTKFARIQTDLLPAIQATLGDIPHRPEAR